MPSLHIAPDESGDVPRCQQECPYFIGHSFDTYVTCEIGDRKQLRRSVCLPRVRELVALAARRCAECGHWHVHATDSTRGWCAMWRATCVGAHEYCARWEART